MGTSALVFGGNSEELHAQLRTSWLVAAGVSPLIGPMGILLFGPTSVPLTAMIWWSIGHVVIGGATLGALSADRRGAVVLADRLDLVYRIGLCLLFGLLPWLAVDGPGAEPDAFILGFAMVIASAGTTMSVALFSGRRRLLTALVAAHTLSYTVAFFLDGALAMACISLVWMMVCAAIGLTAARVHIELVRLRESEEMAARQDHLTGLLNRQGFFDELALDTGGRRSLVIIDLDRFKLINDSYGHQCGDFVLVEAARRLTKVLPESSALSRIGGDEFAAVVPTPGDVHDLAPVFDQVLAELEQPIDYEGNALRVGASIGVTLIDDTTGSSEVFAQADLSMYRSKRDTTHKITFFDSSLREELTRRVELEQRLRTALGAGDVVFWGQCIVRSSDLRPIGIELLARWHDTDGSIVSPAEFIPIAEETGLIVELGRRALDQAAELLDRWSSHPVLSEIEVNVNVSPAHLATGLVDDVIARFPRSDPRLGIEFVETELISAIRGDVQHLDRLRAAGARLVVDDFGVGYSSLSYLWSLPIDTLKIDKSFVDNVDHDPVRHQVIAAIATVADALEIPCVAEGVESFTTLETLHALGIPRIQGFAVNRPEPLEQLEQSLIELVEAAELPAA
ncbi:MAG: EAL domain-containing protein [Actinomycetota bacterium]